jgi:hypothetical protein
MKTTSICVAMIVVAPLIATHTADAHGIAGNRCFDGTLSFDDPAVADEAILPYCAQLDFRAQGSNTSENRLNWRLPVCSRRHWPLPPMPDGFTKIGRLATLQERTKLPSC